MNNILELRDIHLSYHSKKTETFALKELNLAVRPQEFVSIVGPSGCGKTTILSLVAGLLTPNHGEVLLSGEPVRKKTSPKVGYMFQRDNLFEWLNIFHNVTLGLSIRRKKNKKTVAYAKLLLEKYGLLDFSRHHPSQLSGGMRQRVALIRTLATNPEILLLDEPFSALDYQTRLAVQNDVYRIIKSEKKTTVLVTHDISEAVSMSDRIFVLTRRPGKVKKVFDIEFKKGLTPFEKRNTPVFSKYFNMIWEELKSEEDTNIV